MGDATCPDLTECDPLDWSKTAELEWSWSRFHPRKQAAGETFSHQQRVLLSTPAVYYSCESVREKGEMRKGEQLVHAAECMRTTAAPGAVLFFRDECGFVLPPGLDNPAELGKTSKEGETNQGYRLITYI